MQLYVPRCGRNQNVLVNAGNASTNNTKAKAKWNHDSGCDIRLLNSQVVPFLTGVRGDSDKHIINCAIEQWYCS